MLHLIQLLSIFTVVCGSPWTRVANGTNITIEERPFQVSLAIDDVFQCGGSILSSRWILTACHCIAKLDSLVVRAGSTFNDRGGFTFISERLIPHPKFNVLKTFDYDFGLIDLGKDAIPLNGKTMTPVQLPSLDLVVPDGAKVELAGWGFIEDNFTTTNSLMGIDRIIMNDAECGKFFKWEITDRMICTTPSYKATCHGDSGSPLVLAENKVQVGADSFSNHSKMCTRNDSPTVFANIANPEIRSWIKDNTGI